LRPVSSATCADDELLVPGFGRAEDRDRAAEELVAGERLEHLGALRLRDGDQLVDLGRRAQALAAVAGQAVQAEPAHT